MRLNTLGEKGYLSMENNLEDNVENMEDNDIDLRYGCDLNIFIFINIIFC